MQRYKHMTGLVMQLESIFNPFILSDQGLLTGHTRLKTKGDWTCSGSSYILELSSIEFT